MRRLLKNLSRVELMMLTLAHKKKWSELNSTPTMELNWAAVEVRKRIIRHTLRRMLCDVRCVLLLLMQLEVFGANTSKFATLYCWVLNRYSWDSQYFSSLTYGCLLECFQLPNQKRMYRISSLFDSILCEHKKKLCNVRPNSSVSCLPKHLKLLHLSLLLKHNPP